jgi:hypothetical protein
VQLQPGEQQWAALQEQQQCSHAGPAAAADDDRDVVKVLDLDWRRDVRLAGQPPLVSLRAL